MFSFPSQFHNDIKFASAAPAAVKIEPESPVKAPVAEPVRMDEATSDLLKNMTEEDLMKLKKINFKKKVSGM